MTDINQTLQDRGSRYGNFMGHAEVTQDLKDCIMDRLEEEAKHNG